MAIAATVGAALVSGAFAGAGALAASRGASRAAREQRQSTDAAIALERERDAEAKRRYDAEMADRARNNVQREAIRRQLLRRYGLDVPEPRAPIAGAPKTSQAPVSGLSLGTMLGGQSGKLYDSQGGGQPSGPPVPPPVGPPPLTSSPQMAPPGATLGDMSGWSDWKRRI